MIATILSVFCCIAGAYIFYCSAMGAIGQVELLTLDGATCPADFRPIQAHGRRILVTNSVMRVLCSGAVLIAAACSFSGPTQPCEGTTRSIILWSGLALCAWTLISVLISKRLDLKERQEDIDRQWKKEKRISSRHDDEVRLYRVLGAATGIPARNAFLFILMTLTYFLA